MSPEEVARYDNYWNKVAEEKWFQLQTKRQWKYITLKARRLRSHVLQQYMIH